MGVFHLLRHGEHGLLGRALAGRMPGVGMTERGRAEIAAQAERFAGEKIAAIYASPLQRTRETAEIVAARLGLPIEFRDDLLELGAVQHRIVAAIVELTERHLDETVVLVSHGDVIRSALVFLLGMPLDFYNRIEVVQGSISTVRIDASGIRVLALSERPRLPNAGS